MENKKVLKGCAIGFFGLILVIGILTFVIVSFAVNDEEEAKAFDFTVDQYEAALQDSITSSNGTNFNVDNWKKDSEENRYNITLTDGIFSFIYVDKEKNVTRVNTVASGGALLLKNKEVLIAFQSLIESVDPSLSPRQIMVILDKLGINGKSNMLDQETSYTLNGNYYLYQGDIETDTMALQATPE